MSEISRPQYAEIEQPFGVDFPTVHAAIYGNSLLVIELTHGGMPADRFSLGYSLYNVAHTGVYPV